MKYTKQKKGKSQTHTGDDRMAQLGLAQETFGIPVAGIISAQEGAESEASQTEDLIIRAATDKSALERLYLEYRADVFAFSLSLYNNRTIAEDCVQETFIRLPSAAKGFKPGGSAASFILGIAKNVSREMYRSEIKFRAGAAKMETQIPLEAAPQSGALETARTLPKKYRTVLMLRIYSEMTFRDIAKLLRLPESTVKSRYSRALNMISSRMKENGETARATPHKDCEILSGKHRKDENG